ncbi:MAG: zf-HC2 domain-containing protein [Pseudomonadota bacterium]
MTELFQSLRRRMKGLMLKFMPGMITCREFESFIVDYLDNTLEAEQRTLFERHIRLCRECREYLAAYQASNALSATLKSSPDDQVPDSVPQDLVDAVLAARQDQE